MRRPDYIDDDYGEEAVACPNCMGDGEVNCHCGGDMCLCDNYGDAPCPVCHGEGEVMPERSERYFENQRKAREMMRQALQQDKDT